MWCRRKYWRLLEFWWRSRIVRYMGWFQKIHHIERQAIGWIFMVGGDWQEKTTQGPTNYGRMWKHMSDTQGTWWEPKWTIEKPKLDTHSKLCGIYFIDPEAEEFQEIMKSARRKLEVPMSAAMPRKTSLCRSSRETFRAIGENKTE